jgi:hypothetical protein
MATQFGTAAPFGLTAQTGVIQYGNTWSYTDKVKPILDGDGDDTGSTHYGERIDGTITGYIPTSTPFSGTLAATISLTDTPTDYLKGSIGSNYIVNGVTVTKSNEDYQQIEINWYNAF